MKYSIINFAICANKIVQKIQYILGTAINFLEKEY